MLLFTTTVLSKEKLVKMQLVRKHQSMLFVVNHSEKFFLHVNRLINKGRPIAFTIKFFLKRAKNIGYWIYRI